MSRVVGIKFPEADGWWQIAVIPAHLPLSEKRLLEMGEVPPSLVLYACCVSAPVYGVKLLENVFGWGEFAGIVDE